MKLFNRKGKKSSVEQRQFYPYLTEYFSTGLYSGELNPVVDTVVSRISNVIGILPVTLFVHTPSGDREATWDPTYKLLKDPCIEESAMTFYRTIVRMVLVKGNAYIYV